MREQLKKLPANLSACRNAILYKGGNIGTVAKFDNLPSEIDTIPSGDPSYLLVDDTDTTYRKKILSGASPTAKIKSVGGMTYKCNNLLDEEVISPIAVNESGTTRYGWKFDNLPSGTYYLSAFGNYVISNFSISYKTIEGGVYSDFKSIQPNINYVTITISDNQSLIVYLYIGHTNLPEGVHLQLSTNLPSAYEPFFEGLRDSKVTSLMSHGKNLFDANNIITGSFDSTGGFSYGSHILRTETPISVIGGETYTVSCDPSYDLRYLYFYSNGNEYISNIWMARPQSHFYKFTVPSGVMFVNIGFEIDGATSGMTADVSAAKTNSKMQLEIGSNATGYVPYKGVIDTVAIPDVLKNDAEWGHGVVDYDGTVYSNTYDFNNKQYSKGVSNIIVLDGVTDGRKITMKNSGDRFYVTLSPKGLVNANIAFLMNSRQFKKERWGTSGSWTCWIENGNLILKFPTSEFPSITEANAWLAENPIELVYALETPIVTTIEDNAYLPKDNYIEIEGGGIITAVNEHENAVPSNISYIRRTT